MTEKTKRMKAKIQGISKTQSGLTIVHRGAQVPTVKMPIAPCERVTKEEVKKVGG